MSMSRAFPRKGIRGGPGGSGRLDDFVFDVQTNSKVTRDAAPMAKMMSMDEHVGQGTVPLQPRFYVVQKCGTLWKVQASVQPGQALLLGRIQVWCLRVMNLMMKQCRKIRHGRDTKDTPF